MKLHVALEFDNNCSQCWLWILSFCITHWELVWCARELFLSGTLPQHSVDNYILGLVPSHHRVPVCLGAALWADGRDKFNILGFSVTLATKAMFLYQASPVLAFFVVVKTGCVPCTWQNIVAGSRGIQAGRVSKAEGDPGEGSLGCASVLCRCPTAHSADTLWRLGPAAQRGQHITEVTAAAPEDLQAGPRYRSLPQCGASWQGSCCSLHPGLLLAGFSLGLLFNCKSSTWANILLEIRFYLNFKPNENINKLGLLQCNLDT